jgi:hypothetical protein
MVWAVGVWGRCGRKVEKVSFAQVHVSRLIPLVVKMSTADEDRSLSPLADTLVKDIMHSSIDRAKKLSGTVGPGDAEVSRVGGREAEVFVRFVQSPPAFLLRPAS